MFKSMILFMSPDVSLCAWLLFLAVAVHFASLECCDGGDPY